MLDVAVHWYLVSKLHQGSSSLSLLAGASLDGPPSVGQGQ